MLMIVMFLNGLAIMVLEMAGARLLAPALGTSTVVWTSLIGVILACLSLGYWLGGRLADASLAASSSGHVQDPRQSEAAPVAQQKKKKSVQQGKKHTAPLEHTRKKAVSRLSHILFSAAFCVFITALAHPYILHSLTYSSYSLYVLSLITAFLLFALPAILCGMVSPYATRLAISDSANSGAVIGKMNAVSTIGSIVGTFLGGFVLISWFGSTEITLAVAVVLVIAAALVAPKPLWTYAIFLLLLGGFAVSSHMAAAALEASGERITIETPYSSLTIAGQEHLGRPVRLLATDPGSCQSGMYMDDPAELLFEYTRFYALGPYLNPNASRILMLGGGGYSIPKWLLSGRSALASSDFMLDVVELDPGMTLAAEKYLHLPATDPRLHIFHEDARSFLNKRAALQEKDPTSNGTYQLIFADCFNSFYTVPFHVGTAEAAQKIHALLDEDGILIMNIISAVEGKDGRLLRSIHRAFATAFDNMRIFAVRSRYNGDEIQNIMLVAYKTARQHPSEHDPAVPDTIKALLRKEWLQPLQNDADSCPPLTDNYAPVERYALGFTQ